MASPAPNALLDKIDASTMGMHSGIPPHMLTANQLAFAVNVTNRGGHPKTRPNFRKLSLSYADETTQERATQAIFQGAAFYRGFSGKPNAIIASIGGRIFRYQVSGSNVQVQELTTTDVNNPTLDQAWLFQGENYLVINDGKSEPWFWNGAALRRSAGPAGGELPASCMGVYVGGRFVVTLPDLNSYIAGDLVYTQGRGTDAILKTTENTSILGGASFAIPANAGPITSMFTVAIPDTSLGQGPLHIGTRLGVFSATLPLDATLWTSLQQPSQVNSLPNCPGPISFFGTTQVNADAWYRSTDGLRSFSVARRDFNTWVQTALSFELEAILPYDTQSLLGHSSLVRFDNRLIATCSPYRVSERGVAHRGLVALDFNNISSLTTRSQPAYDGLWTGMPILQLLVGDFAGVERCFAFALDGDGNITLYEILRDNDAWFDYDGSEDVLVESWIESNALFGRDELPERIQGPLKKLITADMFLRKLAGEVEVTVQYRPDQYPFWVDWHSFEICAPASDCSVDCLLIQNAQPQYATFQRLPMPAENCNPVTKQLFRNGYFFQFKIMWTGHLEVHKVLTWATPMPEIIPNCPGNSECQILSGCGENYFSYSIE